ncbi:MAG TPA: ankyrin repeat domain-containing protein [Gammaproteobacteria bacterium]|nr:ankyrin repeat domain-containing protein [Gammaproteobacteria bacterium]
MEENAVELQGSVTPIDDDTLPPYDSKYDPSSFSSDEESPPVDLYAELTDALKKVDVDTFRKKLKHATDVNQLFELCKYARSTMPVFSDKKQKEILHRCFAKIVSLSTPEDIARFIATLKFNDKNIIAVLWLLDLGERRKLMNYNAWNDFGQQQLTALVDVCGEYIYISAPYHWAAILGNVPRLASDAESVNKRVGANNVSPLHCAAVGGSVSAVEWLLEHNADVFAKDKLLRSPLQVATDPEVREILIAAQHKRMEIYSALERATMMAILENNKDVFEKCLLQALNSAKDFDDFPICGEILQRGVPLLNDFFFLSFLKKKNRPGYSLFFYLKDLVLDGKLKKFADTEINSKEEGDKFVSAVVDCKIRGYQSSGFSTAIALFKNGLRFTQSNVCHYFIQLAMQQPLDGKDTRFIESLIMSSDLNAVFSERGMFKALHSGNKIAQAGFTHWFQQKGTTPVEFARSKGWDEVVKSLVEEKPKSLDERLDAQDIRLRKTQLQLKQLCETTLILIASRGDLEACKEILESKEFRDTDINAAHCFDNYSEKGMTEITALHMAAVHGRIAVCEYLVDKGARLDVKTKEEETARDLAVRYGRTEIVTFLDSVAKARENSPEKLVGTLTGSPRSRSPEKIGMMGEALRPELPNDNNALVKRTAPAV